MPAFLSFTVQHLSNFHEKFGMPWCSVFLTVSRPTLMLVVLEPRFRIRVLRGTYLEDSASTEGRSLFTALSTTRRTQLIPSFKKIGQHCAGGLTYASGCRQRVSQTELGFSPVEAYYFGLETSTETGNS